MSERHIMFRNLPGLAGVLTAASLSFAVAADLRVVEEIAAKVNGDIITRGELNQARRQLEMGIRQEERLYESALTAAAGDQSKEILREKMDELLLVQKAKELQIRVDAEVMRQLAKMQVASKIEDPEKFRDFIRREYGMPFEDIRQRLANSYLARHVISQEIVWRMAIPEADLQRHYTEHKTDFVRKQRVFLSEILISAEGKTAEQARNAEKKAKDVVARARKGERFGDLALANSDDPETARNGGQLPPYEKGMLEKRIADIVFKEKKGYVTDPIPVGRPQRGFLVLKIDDLHEAGQASFEDVKDEIQEKLAAPMMEIKTRQYLTKLRQDAFLEIKEGYVDSAAAPCKDTRWRDVAQLKPQTATKEEVAARNRKRRFLGIIPRGKVATRGLDRGAATGFA